MATIKDWAKAAGVRAVKTAAQTAVALIGTTAIGMTDVNWVSIASAAVLAAIVSALTSVVGIPEVAEGASVPAINGKHVVKP